MSDYVNTFSGAAKDVAKSNVIAAEHDTEYDAIELSIGTKADTLASATVDNILTLEDDGGLKDSGVQLGGIVTADFTALPTTQASLDTLAKIYHFRTTTTSGTTVGNVAWTYTRNGVYTEVEHNLGHTNFTVMATVNYSLTRKCAVLAKSSTIFRVYTDGGVGMAFEVIVIED